MQPAQGGVAEQRRPPADPQLHQARAGARQDAEGTRADLGIERAAVAFADAIELGALVGDDPGEHIEPADRAFRVGEGRHPPAQGEMLEQRDDINAILFEHRALSQIDLVHRQLVQLVAHARPRPRQKARPHPVGDLAETQIEARRLDLVVADRRRRLDLVALVDRGAQHLRRPQPGRTEEIRRRRVGHWEQFARSRLGHPANVLRFPRSEFYGMPAKAESGTADRHICYTEGSTYLLKER